MQQTITITPGWQVFIPVKIRRRLSLHKPGRAKIEAKKNQIILTPQKSKLIQLAGRYRPYIGKKKLNLNRVRDLVDYSDL